MSQVLSLLSVEAADELLSAQLHVFQLAAKHTDNPIDDQALAFLQSNAEARQWFLKLLGLESGEVQAMSLEAVPVGVMTAAAAAGLSWLEIVNLLVKYGPQLKEVFLVIRSLLEIFKGIPSPDGGAVKPGF